MLVTILVAEIMLAVFLAGTLIIALAVTMRHADPSAQGIGIQMNARNSIETRQL